MSTIAVLIPCYNEEKTIYKVVSDFRRELPEADIYVYDNNSTDGTVSEAERAGAMICHEYRQGKGQVVRRMFQEIEADCYLLVDGDDTYSAGNAKELCESILRDRYDMAVGDRLSGGYLDQNRRRFHGFGNTLVRDAINRLFHADIKDILTGYRAFSYRFVKTFPVLSKGFEIETEMSIHAVVMNMAIRNVPVDYRERGESSTSKLHTVRDGTKVLGTIVRLLKNYKPFLFFFWITVILAIIDLAVLTEAVFIPYAQTGLVDRFPTLIVGCFVAIVGALLFICGLIQESIWQKERREFEFRLMLMSKRRQ